MGLLFYFKPRFSVLNIKLKICKLWTRFSVFWLFRGIFQDSFFKFDYLESIICSKNRIFLIEMRRF